MMDSQRGFRRVCRPTVDGLEPRSLCATIASGSVAIMASSGTATKRPRFSEDYLGPLRSNLNLVKSSAVLRTGRSLTLSATTATRINRRPASLGVDDASFFVFGLNRGGPAAYPVFPERPGIRFDAVVVARVTPEGLSGYVLDIARGNLQTEIDPGRVRVQGRTVKVTIPADTPAPPDGALLAQRMRFAAWSRSRLEHGLADIDDFVASFLPENTTARVRIARR